MCRKRGCVDCVGSGVRSAAYPCSSPHAQVRRATAKVAPMVARRRAPLNHCFCCCLVLLLYGVVVPVVCKTHLGCCLSNIVFRFVCGVQMWFSKEFVFPHGTFELAHSLGFPTWKSNDFPCLRCSATKNKTPQAPVTKTPGGVPPGGMNPTTVWLFAWLQQPIPKHLRKGCCLDGAFCQQQREPRNSWVLGCWLNPSQNVFEWLL